LPARLAELADAAEAWGRGLRWWWYESHGATRRDIGSMPGWCNGSAGLVHLWALAADLAGEPRFRALAEGAAWNAWEEPASSGNLCCGLTGRAYALLHLYRHGGGREWLERARQLAELAASDVSWAEAMPDSLFRGEVGLAVLAADLARPESAVMPFFEDGGRAG
jgi:serine/threonine-protein kinase